MIWTWLLLPLAALGAVTLLIIGVAIVAYTCTVRSDRNQERAYAEQRLRELAPKAAPEEMARYRDVAVAMRSGAERQAEAVIAATGFFEC